MENNRIDNCLNLINDIKVEFEQNCIENSKITTKIENTNDLQTRKIFWSLSSTERALQRCLDISEVEYRKPNPNYDPLKGQVSDEYMMERLRLYNEQKLRKQRLSNTDLVSNNNDNSNLYSSAFSSMMVNPNPDPISSPLPYSSSSSFRYPTLSQQPAASSSNYVETLSEMISKYRFGRTQHISSINSKFETNDINETESDPSLVGFRYNEYSFPQINDMSAFRNWIDVAKHQWKALLDKKGKLIPRSTYVSAVQSPTTVTYKTNTTKRSNTNTNAASSIGITYLESKDIIQGYESLSKALTHMHPSYVYLTFGGSRNPNDWPLYSTKNPCFTYQDTPFPGWHRDISVRQSGRDPGALDTLYRPPNTLRKLRNKGDIVQYLQTEHLPASLLSYFETRPVYCVCHQPQLEGRFYLGCSFGLGGCHGWLHPECVGLSDLTERELEAIEVICPLCAYFIDGITDSERHFKNRR